MMLYFDFEDKRRLAEVTWPKGSSNIIVQLSEQELVKQMPADLYFEIKRGNKVSYTIENPDNKRLTELQNTLCKKLQELSDR